MSDFVNFKLAQKLKEKGFSWTCSHYYRTKSKDLFMIYPCEDWSNIEERVNAPTISQVLKWLRDEKKISIEVIIHCSLKWMCGIYDFSDGIADFTQYDNNGIDDTVYILYDSYEQAALAGVNYCLENLI